MKKIDVVILAGGYGKRIEKFTQKKIPKPLLDIKKKPFLEYLIQNLSKFPINNIYIISGYKGDLINRRYHKKKINLINIYCIKEKNPKGTGYALFVVRKIIKNDFVLINGDTFTDFNLNVFFKKKLKKKFLGQMVLTKNYKRSLTKDLTNLDIGKNGTVILSKKKKYINAGIIFLKKEILFHLNSNSFSFENDILTNLIKEKKISGINYDKIFIDIGTPKNYLLAKKIISKYFYRPAIFLDRDGVINVDKGYTYKIKDFIIKKNIIKILKKYQNTHYFFIVTNQSGIARGFYKVEDFLKFQKYIKSYLSKNEIFINDFEFCPHHPNGNIKKFTKNCECRKPNNLMINKLRRRWSINIKKSFFIGNSLADKICAEKSNLKYLNYTKNLFNRIKP
jgi:D-glycero-D-manno-heptose 1,7-bisphosphate phosphatase